MVSKSWAEVEKMLAPYVVEHAEEAIRMAAWAGALACLRFLTENPDVAQQIADEQKENREQSPQQG